MIIPVRCFTCGKVIGGLYDEYKKLVEDEKEKDNPNIETNTVEYNALNKIGINRYCCRTIFISQVNIIEEIN